jgi:hypothetical protein
MKPFKFFQKNITNSEGGLIAVFAPTMEYFLNWKREIFRDRIIAERRQNYFHCDGVGYKYIAHEVDVSECRFTNFHVISEIDNRKQQILNNVVRSLEFNERL